VSYTLHTPVSVAQTEMDLRDCFAKWGVRDYDIGYNVQRSRLRNALLTRQERAVTVRWMPRRQQTEIVLSSESQQTVADNLRLLYLAIDAMRLNEKRGVADLMRNAYLQLDAPVHDAYAILQVTRTADKDTVTAAYRAAARRSHPDAGGTDEEMARVNAAYEQIQRERGW
jgi:DnaJ-domain-containing protein 1